MLEISSDRDKQSAKTALRLRGRIDSATAGDFEKLFDGLIRSGKKFFAINADGLEFISSAGIASLVKLQRKLKNISGGLAFINLNSEIRMLLSFFSLSDDLPAFDNVAAAEEFLHQKMGDRSQGLIVEQDDSASPILSQYEPAAIPSPRTQSAQTKPAPKPIFPEDQIHSGLLPLRASETEKYSEQAMPSVARLDSSPRPKPEPLVEIQAMPHADTQLLAGQGNVGYFPQIIRCRNCGATLRVQNPGLHACAACRIEFNADASGLFTFFQKGSLNSLKSRTVSEPASPPVFSVPSNSENLSSASSLPPSSATKKAETLQSSVNTRFTEPEIVRCEQCEAPTRVYGPGSYLCPECKIEFRVRAEGTASFYEKL